MTERIIFGKETVTYQGKTCRLGHGGTPLSLDACLPPTLPPAWQEVPGPWVRLGVDREYSRAYVSQSGLQVLVSACIELDKRRWLHVSVSHRGNRLPLWREMCEVKDAFCGLEATAYQVHPPADKHVNIHPKVLHLFCCLDGPVTPDFTRGGDSI